MRPRAHAVEIAVDDVDRARPRVGQRMPTSPKRLARIAGVLYLIVGVFSVFAMYVRGSVRVAGDAAATAHNVAADATWFRLGFAADLVHLTSFLLVAMALFLLLRHVNQRVAAAMVTFVAVAVAVMSFNMVNHLGALLVATNGSYAAAFGSDALVLLFLDLHDTGVLIAQIFYGLWLIPLGYLAYRSSYFPRPLAVLLIVACFCYLVQVAALALSDDGLGSILTPLVQAPTAIAEPWMVGYLLIKGVKAPRPDQPVASAA